MQRRATANGRPGRSSVVGLRSRISPLSPVSELAVYKFQRLEVYQLALDYVDFVYHLSKQLPDSERFNLRSQLERAATSIVLNIAEGSTSQSDPEQARFLGLAVRSFLETVACWDLVARRSYVSSNELIAVREQGHSLFVKLQAFRKKLVENGRTADRGTGDRGREPARNLSIARHRSSVVGRTEGLRPPSPVTSLNHEAFIRPLSLPPPGCSCSRHYCCWRLSSSRSIRLVQCSSNRRELEEVFVHS